jgi:hypothetical protein
MGRAVGDWHEDRYTVMIAVPVIDLLHGTPTRQHRTGRVHFVVQLLGRPDGRTQYVPGV